MKLSSRIRILNCLTRLPRDGDVFCCQGARCALRCIGSIASVSGCPRGGLFIPQQSRSWLIWSRMAMRKEMIGLIGERDAVGGSETFPTHHREAARQLQTR